METNKHILLNAIQQLPRFEPTDKMWEGIELELENTQYAEWNKDASGSFPMRVISRQRFKSLYLDRRIILFLMLMYSLKISFTHFKRIDLRTACFGAPVIFYAFCRCEIP